MNTTDKELRTSVINLAKEIESADFDPYEWVSEQLSIETVMHDTEGNFQGVEILVTCGGPDIRVDTRYNRITGYWGSDSINIRFNDDDRLYSATEEFFGAQL